MPNVDPNSELAQAEAAALDEIIAGRLVRSFYQRIVDLDSGETVGWEALARGPAGSILEFPDRMFGAARRENRVAELDFVCQAAAIEGAIDAGIDRNVDLFINVEPQSDLGDPPDFALRAGEAANERLRVTVEITERELTSRPAELIALVERLRERPNWGVALDDVGVEPGSVGLIPLIEPDVIKLDMSLIHRPMNRDRARTVHAVLAEAERTGTKVLAEGIENEEHLQTARALGARLGQGWHFGRPGPLTAADAVLGDTRRHLRRSPHEKPEPGATPYEYLAGRLEPRRGSKPMLLQMSRALEAEALTQGIESVLISTFQDVSFFTPPTAQMYERLAAELAFVGALAENLGQEPAPGVRGASFEAGAKIRAEWDVVVLAPHFSAAFVSRECEPRPGETHRMFDHIFTYDRDLVATVANQLVSLIAPKVLTGLES